MDAKRRGGMQERGEMGVKGSRFPSRPAELAREGREGANKEDGPHQ
jgi:hypothetical protein